MNLTARIVGDRMEVYDVSNGAVKKTMQLPGNAIYSGPIISGIVVTVGIQFKTGGNRSRSYNIKTGSLISDVQM